MKIFFIYEIIINIKNYIKENQYKIKMDKEVKNGLFYSFIGKYSNIIVQLIINSILARLILPEEYGVLAIIMTFITFFSNLLEMGWSSAVIQKKEINRKFLSSIFYINIILGIVIGGIFYIFSYYFIAFYYNNDIYKILGKYLFFYLFILGLGIVPKALLARQKKFKENAYISLISSILSGIVGIILAYYNFSYYSLIYQGILLNLFIFLFSYKISKFKLRLEFSYKELKSIFGYSSYTFLFNFINYFSRNLDNILIGKYMGTFSLGIYDRAYKLMVYPLSILTHVITPVLHPVLARYQDDKERIYLEYIKMVKILTNLGILISVVLFFSGREIILILYGKNWESVVPIFKILSISTGIQIVLSSSGTIFLASGRSDKLFFTGFISTIIMVTSILLGVKSKKLEVLGYLLFCAFLINFFIGYYVLIKQVLKQSFYKFLKEFIKPLILLLILIFINSLNKFNIENIFFSFIFKGSLNSIIFLMIMKYLYFKEKNLKEMYRLVKDFKK